MQCREMRNSLICSFALLNAIYFGGNVCSSSAKDKPTQVQARTGERPSGVKERMYSAAKHVPKEMTDLGSSPLEFLEKAKLRKGPEYRTGISRNWITLDVVRKLAKRLDSKQPMPHIVSILSSYSANYSSTEGVEAAQMIYGYMLGVYPCNMPIDDRDYEKPMLAEVRAWLHKQHIPNN